MTRSEPRLAWTMPSGMAMPDPAPLLSGGGAREALWALGLSVLVHAGLLGGLGSIVLAARDRTPPPVLEVALVTAAEGQAAAVPDTPETTAEPPPEAAQAAVPPPEPESPPADTKAAETAPPDAPPPEAAPPEPKPAPTAQPAETPSPPKPPHPKPHEAAARPPQLASRPAELKHPELARGAGIDGSVKATPTELGATGNFKAVISPAPQYPPIALQLREEGTVDLLVEVGADGSPKTVTVYKSSGFGSLDEEAIRTLRRWRFSPASKDGRATPMTVYIPLVFRLKHGDG
jgi:protein TonB